MGLKFKVDLAMRRIDLLKKQFEDMVKSTLMTIQTGGQIKSQLNLKQVNDTRNKKPGRVDAASASLAPLALTMSLAAPKYQIQQSFSQLSQIQIQYKRH